MTRQRYSKKESLNRILRILLGQVLNDLPETVTGQILSEDEALSDIVELLNNSLPNESLTLPSTLISAIEGAGFFVPKGARIYNNLVQETPKDELYVVIYNSVRWDDSEFFDPLFPTRLTVNDPGRYYINTSISFESSNVGQRRLSLRVNSDTFIDRVDSTATPLDEEDLSLSTVWEFEAGEYVETTCFHNNNTNLDILSTSARSPEFTIQKTGT